MDSEETREVQDWAADELGAVQLGDKRLTSRLVSLARTLARASDSSLPQALPQWHDLKAAYRFFDNAKAVPEHILAGHIDATWSRARTVPLVLAVQDTTYLDWSHMRTVEGLGPLGSRYHFGIVSHTTLAVTPERLPLGLLQQRNWVRDPDTYGALESHQKRDVRHKESIKWLESVDALAVARSAAPETTFVSVGDREADLYELLAMPRAAGVELLVRAAWDRTVVDEHRYLWETVAASAVMGRVEMTVPRHRGEPARQCTLALRSIPVQIKAPRKRSRTLPDIAVWAILALEESPMAGRKPIEWMLLTTIPTTDAGQAIERVQWYTCRWTIEVWHRVLKTGCRIEARQLETVERLAVALTLYSIVAWRLLYATMLTRTDPDIPCSVLLSEPEWQALYCSIHRVAKPSATPPALGTVLTWIAKMGGYLARKNDGPPGPQVIWRGFQHLPHITEMFLIMRKSE
jgi:hypothetical protein